RIVFAQGYYSQSRKDAAPANKASDLNTAAAWLFSGKLEDIPSQLRATIEECRQALRDCEIDSIELLYVHNLPESVNANKELQTAAAHLKKAIGEPSSIIILSREMGSSAIEHLFAAQESHIEVKEVITCPAKVAFTENGPNWEASVLSVPGAWLNSLFTKYGDNLFSANYRGFL
ncbi:MAG: hypothetical protein HQK59_10560, partial [Deltaproteobacteria bacterium]|nr:hypothetical protein [Deltaproteobacteria bacterium]